MPNSLVQSTTAPSLHVDHRDDRGPISLASPGPPNALRRLCTAVTERVQIWSASTQDNNLDSYMSLPAGEPANIVGRPIFTSACLLYYLSLKLYPSRIFYPFFLFLFFTKMASLLAYACSGSLPLDLCIVNCIALYCYLCVANEVLSLSLSNSKLFRFSIKYFPSYFYTIPIFSNIFPINPIISTHFLFKCFHSTFILIKLYKLDIFIHLINILNVSH